MLEVHLEGAGTERLGDLHEPRRGVDRARGADRHEQVGPDQGRLDARHLVGHLPEPDDVRSQGVRAAPGARGPVREVAVPAEALAAPGAPRRAQLAVHVHDLAQPGPLVQVVDVLRHHQQAVAEVVLEHRQGRVRRVGRHGGEGRAAGVVERLDDLGLRGVRLGRRDVLDPVVLPEAVGVAEGA